MRRKGLRLVLPGAVAAAMALGLAACGGDDHSNEPRPATPFEVSAKVGSDRVIVSPKEFGAGLAVFSISNQTDEVVQLVLEGPTDAASGPIEAGGVSDSFKVPLQEGVYEVSTGDELGVRAAELVIGPERHSSSNELLLP